MFVFMLITAELAILYTVYWYLFLRQPETARRISAGNWGSYKNGSTADDTSDPVRIQSFMLPAEEQMVLDLKTNHYVPLPQQKRSFLSVILLHVDDYLSKLNVKA